MILEHELRSAAFRDFLDVAFDRFNLRRKRFADVAGWDVLKADAEAGQEAVRCALLPQYPPNLVLKSYTTSLALDADGTRKTDQRVSTLKYVWRFCDEELHFWVGMINDQVTFVELKDEDRIETLLTGDLDMKATLERDLRAALG